MSFADLPVDGTLDATGLNCPEPVMMLHQHIRDLAPGGLLVCANIDLNGPLGARRVRAELADTQRWQLLQPLESGLTRVARRLPAA